MIPVVRESDQGRYWALTLVLILALVLGLATPAVSAQDNDPDFDPHPLRPADTSSPRDTLNSFLTNANEAIEEWRPHEKINRRTARAYIRAVATLDLSTTPDSDSWGVRTQRMLLLKELLDRIELPPDNEIPGKSKVTEDGVTQWTIPDTAITIARVETGPRAGEFLFSAGTVERLQRFYANAKHLPYKPGASAGIYEQWTRSGRTEQARVQPVRNRLKPVDATSPRSTLDGFLDSMNRAYTLVMEADAALATTPPKMTREEAREISIAAENLLQRAVHTLDLSQVPQALREDAGIEAALQLKETFDRMQLPPVDTVPDARMIALAQENTAEPIHWRYPSTEIEIVEITEGERQGQFLFSAATVSRIGDYFERVQHLPYQTSIRPVEWKSPHRSEGFYQYYISTPGYMVPRLHFLGRFVEQLPPWLETMHSGQTLWQWIGLLISLLALALAAWVVYRVLRRTVQRLRSPLDDWLMILVPITIAIITGAVTNFIDTDLNITGNTLAVVTTSARVIIIGMAAWAVLLLSRALAETVIATPRIGEHSSEAALLRIGSRVVGYLLGAWVVLDGIQALGVNLIPLLAGLGVGGLAIALAAQSTIANFIGGLILFANKPVRVGDFCRYGEDPNPGWLRIGTVEDIGLLSTRIRGIDRTITNIPNAEFSKMHIVNLAKRDRRLLRTTLQLRYETTPEQLRYVLVKLRELLIGHPMVMPDPARVRFVGFGAYSLDLEIFAYLRCIEQNDFLAIQEDLFLRMADIVTEAGTAFAFPSQTAYLARDSGLDAERKEHAEGKVEHWRGRDKLPFPEFEDEERERLEDILDYPPKGSPRADK